MLDGCICVEWNLVVYCQKDHEGASLPCPVFLRSLNRLNSANLPGSRAGFLRPYHGDHRAPEDHRRHGPLHHPRCLGPDHWHRHSGGNSQTTYRNASGRLTGSASSQGSSSASSRTPIEMRAVGSPAARKPAGPEQLAARPGFAMPRDVSPAAKPPAGGHREHPSAPGVMPQAVSPAAARPAGKAVELPGLPCPTGSLRRVAKPTPIPDGQRGWKLPHSPRGENLIHCCGSDRSGLHSPALRP